MGNPAAKSKDKRNLTHAVGECILAWAGVEETLTLIFSKVAGVDVWTAAAIMDAVVAFRAKLQAVDQVVGIHVEDLDFKKRWEGLSRRTGDKVLKRNEIAHSGLVWRTTSRRGGRWVVVPYPSINKRHEGFSAAMLKERAESFSKLDDDLTQWLYRLERDEGRS